MKEAVRDARDMALRRTLSHRGIDLEGEINNHPKYLEEAYQSGKQLADESLMSNTA